MLKPGSELAFWLAGVGCAIAATGLAVLGSRLLGLRDVSPIFILAVLLVAVRAPTRVALATALLCFVAYNWFFIEPLHSLAIAGQEVVTVTAFVLVAVFCGGLAGRLREQLVAARAEADHLAERARLERELETARVQHETERLRAALLASVSHDLRSPLAGIIGAATSLSEYGARMSEQDRAELLGSVLSEGVRLDRYIQNLLDMTRLGHGTLEIERDFIALDDILGAALGRLRRAYPDVDIVVDLPEGLPLLYVHPALIEQALFNILENGARFTPPGRPLRIGAAHSDSQLVLDIVDEGPGIPEAERQRVFDMFYSVSRGDSSGPGTGLGLAICRGMLGAHGGSVAARPGPHGVGTAIEVRLPLEPRSGPVEEPPE